jgi:class 3 adenylate cyclase
MFQLFKRRPPLSDATSTLATHTIESETIDRFTRFLESADERDLYHTNPRHLAGQLELSERATLKLLLAALYEGIVTLHWDVRCPACGGIGHPGETLANLQHDMDCPMCGNHFAPHLDHEVRVTFSLHERLRTLSPEANDLDHRTQIDEQVGPTPGLALLTMPDFQRLFPQQRLLPDESLDVTRLALLFTDLAGSTALYARRGDPRAYHLVRLHFDELFRVADTCSGTTVKTIGDAILAVFQTPIEAFSAANDMQQAIAFLNDSRNLRDEERLILKVGLHSGPCLSVTLNDRPDFFGTTVNTAARVQGLSLGNDLVFTEAVRSDQDVQKALGPTSLESHEVTLKGLEGPVLVHRLQR